MKKILILLLGILLLGIFVHGAEGGEDYGAYTTGEVTDLGGGSFQLINIDSIFSVNDSEGNTTSIIQGIDGTKPAKVTIDENNQITEMEMTAGKDIQIKINGEFINVPEGMTIKYKEGGYEIFGGKGQVVSFGENEDLLTDIKFTKPDQKISIGKDNVVTTLEGVYIGEDHLQTGSAEIKGPLITKLGPDSIAIIEDNKIITLSDETYISYGSNYDLDIPPQKGGVDINSYEGKTEINFKKAYVKPLVSKTEDYRIWAIAEDDVNTLKIEGNEIELIFDQGEYGKVENGRLSIEYQGGEISGGLIKNVDKNSKYKNLKVIEVIKKEEGGVREVIKKTIIDFHELEIRTGEKIIIAENKMTDVEIKEKAEKARKGAKGISDKIIKPTLPGYKNTVKKIEERNKKLKEALEA